MTELLGIIAGGVICFLLNMGLHKAVDYGRREGIVAKKYPDEDCFSSEFKTME